MYGTTCSDDGNNARYCRVRLILQPFVDPLVAPEPHDGWLIVEEEEVARERNERRGNGSRWGVACICILHDDSKEGK